LKKGKEKMLDLQKFESLFQALYTPLCQSAFRLVRDQHAAEDIVQDVFCTLWRRKEELEIENFEGYLFRSVYNASLNAMKKHKDVSSEPLIIEMNQRKEVLDIHIETKETAKAIHNAIDSLPPACRNVFILSRYEGMSNKQIADTLDISVKTVENQMTKALRALRDALAGVMSFLLLFLNTWG
jgi:RNA polymerase sigma-70 factor (ECF subfamily)